MNARPAHTDQGAGAQTSLTATTPPTWRWVRRIAGATAAMGGLAAVSNFGAAWHFSGEVINVDHRREYPVRILSVDGDQVTLTRGNDSDRAIEQGLVWPDGHAHLGAVTHLSDQFVVREVRAVTRGDLRAGLNAYLTGFVFDGDPWTARGLKFESVTVRAEIGDLPGWFLPGHPDQRTWLIAVHGRGARPSESLRVLPTIHQIGLPTLVVTYRNDEDAPAGSGGQYRLGDTEWEDVAAAIEYAIEHGATAVVLYGWSMGGAISLTALRRLPARLRHLVRALVLDCPVIDWQATLAMQGRQLGLPRVLTWSACRLVERRIGTRLAALDHRPYAPRLDVPTLIFLDADDATVAPGPTRDFAAARPDLVTLVETIGGGHTRSWNVDPSRYEQRLHDFLETFAPR